VPGKDALERVAQTNDSFNRIVHYEGENCETQCYQRGRAHQGMRPFHKRRWCVSYACINVERAYFQLACELCPHHSSHYLGMDVHDVKTMNKNVPLQPGMVLTVEPGRYA
jgi:hypothetical protein